MCLENRAFRGEREEERPESRRTGFVRAGFIAPLRLWDGMRGRSMGPVRVQSVRRMS